jgi:hypothetical protein
MTQPFYAALTAVTDAEAPVRSLVTDLEMFARYDRENSAIPANAGG